MFFRGKGFGRGKKRRHRHCLREVCPPEVTKDDVIPLSECPEDTVCLVVCNPIKSTKEIGINPGKNVQVFKNSPSDGNMVISLETSRYIIAKSLADEILVTLKTESDE